MQIDALQALVGGLGQAAHFCRDFVQARRSGQDFGGLMEPVEQMAGH
ncbi:hypothetical protein [Rhodothermus marinus]|nr:hypothetical protein [Rhodothermus marinus]